MIVSGEKKEEYREIKKYYISRFNPSGNLLDDCRDYAIVEFRNGYGKKAPTMSFRCEGVTIGQGNPDWGAIVGQEYYVIKLGEVLKHFFI